MHKIYLNVVFTNIPFGSNGNGGGNRSNETKLIHQETATEQTIQQMTNGFMALFEDKFDQAQDSLKEALYVDF